MDFRMQECLPRKYARDMPESPPPWRSLETNILEVKVQPLWSAQEVLGQRGATLFFSRASSSRRQLLDSFPRIPVPW
jgi:hypothetical protein